MYYFWAALLFLANAVAWGSTLVMLPGNWIIVALAAMFALAYPQEDGRGVSWTVVVVVAALAGLGELIEFAASAAGVVRQGASRRAAVLAVVGTIVGSLCGATLTFPIPLVGPILGVIAGGCLGAFLGAFAGELSKGKTSGKSATVGLAAMIGRLLGTVGKLLIGAVMVVVVAVDVFF